MFKYFREPPCSSVSAWENTVSQNRWHRLFRANWISNNRRRPPIVRFRCLARVSRVNVVQELCPCVITLFFFFLPVDYHFRCYRHTMSRFDSFRAYSLIDYPDPWNNIGISTSYKLYVIRFSFAILHRLSSHRTIRRLVVW